MTVRRFLRAALPSAAALALGVLLSLGGLELATRVLAIAPPLPHQNTFAPDDVLPWKGFRGRGAGAQIVFLHVPQKGPWEDGSHETPTRLQKLCANRECIAIDALPAMRAHPDPESLHYPKNGHCTEAGYALIADVVVRELDARGMLPETLRLADRPGAASIPLGGR